MHTLSQTAPATSQPPLPALTGTAAAEVRQHQHIWPTIFVQWNEGEESLASASSGGGREGWVVIIPAPGCVILHNAAFKLTADA